MRILITGFCVILITLSGCVPETDKQEWQPNKNMPQLRAEYEQARTAWESLDIQNYQFYGVNHTYYDESVIIKVRNGSAKKIVSAHDGWPADFPVNTVNKFFDFIDAAFLAEEYHDYQPDSGHIGTDFIVSYDSHYHYPVEFEIIKKTARCSVSNTKLEILELRLPEEEKWQPNENTQQLITELEQRRADWEALDIKNYQYILQKLYNPQELVFWDYRSKITIKNGQVHESVGLYPDTYHGDNSRIENIFNDIYGKLLEEQIGWSTVQRIGMNFTINYDPQYHFPIFFDYEDIVEKGHP